jgi:hypothetical protein
MKRRKRMGLPPARSPTSSLSSKSTMNASEVAAVPLAGNTIAMFAERLNTSDVRSIKTADARRDVDAHHAPVMTAADLRSDQLQQEQDRFDAAMAKVPSDKFVKGIGNLIRKRGL